MRNNDNILRKAEIQNTHFHYKIALKEIICIAVAFYCQRNLCKAQENLKGIFNVHVTVHLVKFLKMKPTRCTNFSNLLWVETLRVSDSFSVHHQEFFTVHKAVVYVIQVCCVYSEKFLVMDGGIVRNMQSF